MALERRIGSLWYRPVTGEVVQHTKTGIVRIGTLRKENGKFYVGEYGKESPRYSNVGDAVRWLEGLKMRNVRDDKPVVNRDATIAEHFSPSDVNAARADLSARQERAKSRKSSGTTGSVNVLDFMRKSA